MTADSPASAADDALRLVGSNPRRAMRLATEAAQAARTARDYTAESRAHRAYGLAALQLGQLDEALVAMRTAIRRAERSGVPLAVAEARMSRAYVLFERGAADQALAEADAAAAGLRGVAAGRLLGQRALLLQRCGRTAEALAVYRRAVPLLRDGDPVDEAQLRNNRGILLIYTGRLNAAKADLERSRDLLEQIGSDLAVGKVDHNLGMVSARAGDVPTALASYDAAEATFRRHGQPLSALMMSRAELLLAVGLRSEARENAARAVAAATSRGQAGQRAEALLTYAQAALGNDDEAAALDAAEKATKLFTRQGRPGWAVVARYVALRADERAGRLTWPVRRRALRVADELAEIGWRTQELDARIVAARVALEHGHHETVTREMRQTAAARTTGPVELRIRAWYAEALLRLATDRRAGAERAVRAGFRVMERQRLTLGATELRVHVAGHANDLADLGLQLAFDSNSPTKVLDWAERWRARALELRPVRPPDDAALAAALAELRGVTGDAESALLEGRSADRLLARKATLEERVRRLARRSAGPLFATEIDPPRLDEIAAGLDDRVLVELIGWHGVLQAVTVRDGQARVRTLGESQPIRRILDTLLFALRRLALQHGSTSSLNSALESVGTCAARLQAALLDPIADELGDRPLVVVPTGSLRSTPWSLLPMCLGRSVTVAPSAAVWLRAARRPRERTGSGSTVLVCGPRLNGAAAEIEQLARAYPAASRLDGEKATVEAALSALDGADVAHVAAHGRLRADNPLFSALELADGQLTAYDLERLGQAPRLVLLPACQSGVASVLAGDEVMGLTSALFALGTRTAVATVVPVPDEATRPLMVAMHDGLRKGLPAAEALAAAQRDTDRTDPAALATAGGFVCYGAG